MRMYGCVSVSVSVYVSVSVAAYVFVVVYVCVCVGLCLCMCMCLCMCQWFPVLLFCFSVIYIYRYYLYVIILSTTTRATVIRYSARLLPHKTQRCVAERFWASQIEKRSRQSRQKVGRLPARIQLRNVRGSERLACPKPPSPPVMHILSACPLQNGTASG